MIRLFAFEFLVLLGIAFTVFCIYLVFNNSKRFAKWLKYSRYRDDTVPLNTPPTDPAEKPVTETEVEDGTLN